MLGFVSVLVFLIAALRCACSFAISFDDIEQEMQRLAKRDMVLSQNIAHANTPGYLPKDVARSDQSPASLALTHDMHLSTTASDAQVYDAELLELKPNGNGVTVENELAKKSENSLYMKQITSLFAQNKNLLSIALGGGAK